MNSVKIEVSGFALLSKKLLKGTVSSVLEIGSFDGEDGAWLAKQFSAKDVYLVEPHPELFKNIRGKFTDYKVINKAFSDTCGQLEFNATRNLLDGRSSLKKVGTPSPYWAPDTKYTYNKVLVECTTGKDFMKSENIDSIDLCKIDVEGLAYQVISGFGDRLKDIKAIQVECEYKKIWENQYVWDDVRNLLESNNFKLVWECDQAAVQIDSIWINKKYLRGA